VTSAFISSGLEFNDNYDLSADSPGNSVFWDTTIGVGLETQTPVDELSFDASGVLRVQNLPDNTTEASADNPIISLGYDRVVDDNSLGFFVRGNRADVAFFDPFSDLNFDNSFDDTFGTGTRNSIRGGADIALNEDGPVSLTGFAQFSDVTYEDTDDPELYDQRDGAVGGQLGFRVSPILTLTTGGSYFREDNDDGPQTGKDRWRADVGMIGQLNQRAQLVAQLGYSRQITERNNGEETAEGLVGDLSVIFDERRGATSLSFNTTLDENGQRYTLSYGKSVAWDNAELDANIGVSTNEDTELRGVGSINYQLSARDTLVTFGLRQNATTDDEGRNVLNTSGIASVQRSLTRRSSVGLTAQGGLQRVESNSSADTERFNVTAQFNHALTQDWNANVGYRYRYRRGDGDTTNEESMSNAVFFAVSRGFQASR
jgi:hypothetical protein